MSPTTHWRSPERTPCDTISRASRWSTPRGSTVSTSRYGGRVDLIVANPPYVSEREFEGLDPVLRFEPRGALVAPDHEGVEGFADLALIVPQAYDWLGPGGALICEHASNHREPATTLARATGYAEVSDLDDLAGLARVLVARR